LKDRLTEEEGLDEDIIIFPAEKLAGMIEKYYRIGRGE